MHIIRSIHRQYFPPRDEAVEGTQRYSGIGSNLDLLFLVSFRSFLVRLMAPAKSGSMLPSPNFATSGLSRSRVAKRLVEARC